MKKEVLLVMFLVLASFVYADTVGDFPLCSEERIDNFKDPKWEPWMYPSCGSAGCFTTLQGISEQDDYVDCGWGEAGGEDYGLINWHVDTVGFRNKGESCKDAGELGIAKWQNQMACYTAYGDQTYGYLQCGKGFQGEPCCEDAEGEFLIDAFGYSMCCSEVTDLSCNGQCISRDPETLCDEENSEIEETLSCV